MAVQPGSPARAPKRGLLERIWNGPETPAERLLAAALVPAELLFRVGVTVRDRGYRWGLLPSRAAPVPALSVGNLSVGGTGKTPVVRWLVDALRERGRTPGILHGGYASDEPALHRHWFPDLPVVEGRDRVAGARQAAAAGADVVVLDDAFQHRRLRRDLDVVLVDAEAWPGHLLPRGPYREGPGALRRAHIVVVTVRTDRADPQPVMSSLASRTDAPVVSARLEAGEWLTAHGFHEATAPDEPVLAVAAIGRPEAFFRQLAKLGVSARETLAYRDHHSYTPEDAALIRERAGGRPVATTAKDAVKLAPLLPNADIRVLEQRVDFHDGGAALLDAAEAVL